MQEIHTMTEKPNVHQPLVIEVLCRLVQPVRIFGTETPLRCADDTTNHFVSNTACSDLITRPFDELREDVHESHATLGRRNVRKSRASKSSRTNHRST